MSRCGASEDECCHPNGPAADAAEIRAMTLRLAFGAVFAIPLAVLVMGAHPGWWPAPPAWLECALATPVVFGAGWPFFQRGWDSIVRWRFNMFTLIALGVGTAWLSSVARMLVSQDHHLYFEAAATIVVLVLLGQVLELRAKGRTGEALRDLATLVPPTAVVLQNGSEIAIPVSELTPGMLIRIKPGNRLPVDGSIVEGASALDESMLTGESLPVARAAGDKVSAGTLNTQGSFLYRAEKVGADTLLAAIVRLVATAQSSRAPIQRLADAVSARFVPFVLVIALVALAAWLLLGGTIEQALSAATAVLIIACPCALGLATPMSIVVAVGRGARAGVLVRHAEALEVLARTTILATDKTGTLTEGRPTLVRVLPILPITSEHLLQVAASLEVRSEHPLAPAIARAADGIQLLPVRDFRATPGAGIEARVAGQTVRIGSRSHLDAAGITGFEALAEAPSESAMGRTLVWVAADQRLLGALSLSDQPKPGAADCIQLLARWGVRTIMLTGDSAGAATAVARNLGISEFHAQCSPADKLALIARWKAGGQRVAMGGDGVNDAPALAAADVGIAMGGGSETAIHSAGITLLKGELKALVTAFALSHATLRNIRQNLTFAFLYNGLAIPIAAGALYPLTGILLSPVLASAAMALSSLCVITNALRLRTLPLPSLILSHV